MMTPSSLPSVRRRHALAGAALLGLACALPGAALAQAWPAKPITIVVPFRRAAPPTSWRAFWAKGWKASWASPW